MTTQMNQTILPEKMPILALRGLVLFPGMMLHFEVGRKKSMLALNRALHGNQTIFLVPQLDIRDDDPDTAHLSRIGIVATVRQVLKQTGDTCRVLVEGLYRGKIDHIDQYSPYIFGSVTETPDIKARDTVKNEALLRTVKMVFQEYLLVATQIPADVINTVKSCTQIGYLADYIASNILLDYPEKQQLLCELNESKRLQKLLVMLSKEIQLLAYEGEIVEKVKQQIDQNQKEYYLREQLRVITEELGDNDNPQNEAEELRMRVLSLHLPEEAEEKLLKECDRLFKMPPGSHEANVIRTYLDACFDLPWNKSSQISIDIAKAQKLLDRDHYGLTKVKERILELLAVKKLAPDQKGQILCLVGPPGVGKTSIAKSVAKAIGCKYVRIALGGVRDEADIRGHRRTYIGAMPGRIMDALKQAGTNNPLILLDEVDKLGKDSHGDPTSALLEVLDAEQNNTFHDHYIDLPFDLSHVLFVTTANDYSAIPAPLRDRMEVIELGSYTSEEKYQIAKGYLLPKQRHNAGLTAKQVQIKDDALRSIIDHYTKEAGVRTLERTIASVFRKAAKAVASGETKKIVVRAQNLEDYLGPKKYRTELLQKKDEVGVVTGLAWTSVGGETMPIEVAVMDGSGKIELTGSLGDVMKESAKAAISCVRCRVDQYHIAKDFYKSKDIHIHVPEGAVPKDGPSAGVGLVTALVSALTGIPVRADVAMTGEITLRGRVLPIGGLKEKSMAAYRQGIQTVIIPQDNLADLSEVDEVVKQCVTFVPVCEVDTVLKTALVPVTAAQETEPINPVIPQACKPVYAPQ